MSAKRSAEQWMGRALRLAWRGRGWVEPNPMVGAVLVRAGKLLGEGWHRRFGGPHAEVEALRDAAARGHDVRGATLYVTLEPCCHHGKTPPCTDAILAAGVGHVVAAMLDPFPQVAGRGAEQLRQAGLRVEVGLLQQQARRLNQPFVHRLQTARPWVIAKWAQTLDGRIATRSGDSQWISNARSRRLVHRLRGRVDAVMVGIGTVLADNPRLTARDVPVRRVARRVVIDPDLRLPMDAALLDDLPTCPLTVAVRPAVLERSPQVSVLRQRGVELLSLPPQGTSTSRLALQPLLEHLAKQHGATNVLVEGGASLMASLFDQDLVNEVWCFVAPRLLGDAQALPPIQGAALRHIADARTLSLRLHRRLDDDLLLQYTVGPR